MFARRTSNARRLAVFAGTWLVLSVALVAAAPGTKTITFQDLMKFKAIEKPVVSEDGTVVAYGLQPDRGDGEGVVHARPSGKVWRVPLGGSPLVSKDARWVAMALKPSFAATEKAGKEKPKPGMALVNVATGAVVQVDAVDRFAFSDDSRWLAYLLTPPQAPRRNAAADATASQEAAAPAKDEQKPGGTLKLRDLAAGTEREIAHVASFAFDPASKHLACAVAGEEGRGNGLFLLALTGPSAAPVAAVQADKARYGSLAWSKKGGMLAFLAEPPAAAETGGTRTAGATLMLWDAASQKARPAASAAQAPAGWTLPSKNELSWSEDGKRVFFGVKPVDPRAQDATSPKADPPGAAPDPYDVARILSKVEGDVWHWNDPRIIPQQKIQWEHEKDRTYKAVLHVDTGKVVQLATLEVPDVAVPDNARIALATSDVPYAKLTTWDQPYRDVYAVNLDTGTSSEVTKKVRERSSLSPDGKWIAFFDGRNWRLYDTTTGTTHPATDGITASLVDEEHDTPSAPPPYGLGGWVDQGASLLVYDRYDIWRVPSAGGAPVNVTGGEGRRRAITFRVVAPDPESKSLPSREPLLLTAYHDREKNWGFYAASFAKAGVEQRLDEKKLFKFVARAKKADVLLYTREDYGEFPDLWVSGAAFTRPARVSDANPQLADFAWGTAELVDYTSQDGVPLQGVLIKPAGYEAGRRYPVITYFYERESQRLYEFNEPVVNHRPSFAVYAGAGYAIFLPDIVFTPGHPGQSIMKCLIPAVQKLVDMGVADPKRLGLHGHSWGGYGTAYVVTQTDMFAAAVAGAPVANMTSAYGGIRWESGLARQFQYEKDQSRIGGSLWEKRDLFIENSALFFADRVKTPLLIEHGDEDGAVPWYQGIEMYLALRRLGKDCILLQYRGEPHHLKKYANKLDYSIKMKQYFDHYLLGEPAAEWIAQGVPYRGR